MSIDVNDIILQELRGMRTEMNEGFNEVKQRVTAVETVTVPFFETDGGRDKMQNNIDDLKKSKWFVLGGAGTLSYLIHALGKKIGF